MIPSIRTFLIINLLLSLALVTSLSVIGNLFLEHRHMQRGVDARLIETAIRLNSFLKGDFFSQLNKAQKLAVSVTLSNSIDPNRQYHAYFNGSSPIQYQVYNAQGQLILRSSHAPPTSFASAHTGFGHATIDDAPWRTYTLIHHQSGMKIAVAESYTFLQTLEKRITQDAIIIMLITYPLLALLIWVIVGRGFEGVNQLAKNIKQRSTANLEAIDPSGIPTEIRPFILELNHLFERLNETMESQKRFAGDAAHELRTPLAVLKTQAQVALQSKADSERNRAIQHLITGVERCTHIVQQLLTMSKMVPESALNDIKHIDLNGLSMTVLSHLAPFAIDKDIEVELIELPEPATIEGNQTAIEILLRNLIDNAIRYTPPQGQVTVRITQSPQHTTLHVEDNGPGISPDLRDRVFERFFRVVGNKARGSGLGLGIVKKIADLHQAILSLNTPKTGKGLRVTVKFPRRLNAKSL